MKTARQIRREHFKAAKSLPTGTKKIFWAAMLNGKNLGEASAIADINNTNVATELVLQCFKTLRLPMSVDEIV